VSQKRRSQLEEAGAPASATAEDAASPPTASIPVEDAPAASVIETPSVETSENGVESATASSVSETPSTSPDVEATPSVAEEVPVAEAAPEPTAAEGTEDSAEEVVEAPQEVEESEAAEAAVESSESEDEAVVESIDESATDTPEKRDGQDLVAEGPASDEDALAAIDRMPRRKAPAADTPDFGGSVIPPAERCEPAAAPVDSSRMPLFQLHMTKWGMEGDKPFAILAPKAGGEEFRIDLGDRVGPNGGLVVGIKSDEVTVHELRLDPAGESTTVQDVIRLK